MKDYSILRVVDHTDSYYTKKPDIIDYHLGYSSLVSHSFRGNPQSS